MPDCIIVVSFFVLNPPFFQMNASDAATNSKEKDGDDDPLLPDDLSSLGDEEEDFLVEEADEASTEEDWEEMLTEQEEIVMPSTSSLRPNPAFRGIRSNPIVASDSESVVYVSSEEAEDPLTAKAPEESGEDVCRALLDSLVGTAVKWGTCTVKMNRDPTLDFAAEDL